MIIKVCLKASEALYWICAHNNMASQDLNSNHLGLNAPQYGVHDTFFAYLAHE